MIRLVLLLSFALLPACYATPELPVWPGDEIRRPDEGLAPYVLHPGDSLEIRFPAYPEWNQRLTVRPDGRAAFPLVGELQVAGQSMDAVQEQLARELVSRIRSPLVELSIAELHRRAVYVGGEVDYPGEVEITGQALSLTEAVFARGGPKWKTSDPSSVILSRSGSDGLRRAWIVDLEEALYSAAPVRAVMLQPGDVVLVPPSGIARSNAAIEQYVTRMIPASNLMTGFVLTD